MKRLHLCIISLFLSSLAFAQNSKERFTLVITNANIVDVTKSKIIPNRLLAISGDTIRAIDDTKKVKNYKASRYVDAAGKYVIPGLWDMHIHLRGGDSLANANKALLPLFLVYGVTTVRECGGDIPNQVLTWRKQITQGELIGPKIFTSVLKIDGPKSTWAGSLEVKTPGDISSALDSLQKMKVDFVKVYESKISREAFLETLEQAQKRGLKTSGHMPFTVKLTEAVNRGLDASEHMFYVYKGCSSKEDSITQIIQTREHTDKPLGLYASLSVLNDTYDKKTESKLFKYLAHQKFAIVPTLFVAKTVIVELKDKDHSKDTLLSYIDPKIKATYQGRVNSAKKQSAETSRTLDKFMLNTKAMIPQMYAAGINIMAGSDCGAFNSFVYPGESLHEEVKLLAASGLTPGQALQTATINGAKFMEQGNFYGSIQKGKSSDIVVLDKNPLTDIKAIDHINMVLSKGRLYSRNDLDNLLRSIKH